MTKCQWCDRGPWGEAVRDLVPYPWSSFDDHHR